MPSYTTIPNSKHEHDRYLSQPQEGLIEQQLVTLYKNADGTIYQETLSRRFSNNDYNDSSTSKHIG